MKNLVVALAVFLSIGSLNAQQKKKGAAAPTGPQKTAYLKGDSITRLMECSKRAEKRLEDYSTDARAQIEALNLAAQKMYNTIEAQGSSMNPTMKKFKEDELRRKSAEIDETTQLLQNNLQELSQAEQKPITEALLQAIEKVCVRKGIAYVFEKGQLYYCKGGIDITEEVLVELLIIDKQLMLK